MVGNDAVAWIAIGIERLAKPRKALAAGQPAGHHRHRIASLQELAEQAFCTLGLAAMEAAGQCAQCGCDYGVGGRSRRSDAARNKGRRIELVIGDQHQATTD